MPRRDQKGAHKKEAPAKLVKGIIQLTRRATGYLAWPDEPEKEDIEIRTENLGGALNGDEVEVKLTGLYPRPRGAVVNVLSRAKTEFVGTLRQAQGKPGELVVVPADVKFYRPIRLKGNVPP